MAERFKAAVLKTAVCGSIPWVRIPPHPVFVVRDESVVLRCAS
ncbi:hypothetical protein NRI_0789 [Neorickettsia risticii str. Illinois]|uniref:Uncharacterized protein n=1 Tax=Neorickettsia risticii (strain Illinois) TaxID=434131 RepID=C6V5U4_NEORI|nr:hypothetical protein NRI_0789 [Neorickettsia risticii str. Illinois]